MMPDSPAPRGAPSPVSPEGNPQNAKPQIEAQLVQLLQQAAKIAADNGIDFQAILMKFMHGSAGGPPRPPSALG